MRRCSSVRKGLCCCYENTEVYMEHALNVRQDAHRERHRSINSNHTVKK